MIAKRSGKLEQWDDSKFIKAVNKAATRVGEVIDY
ncbi:hypothetical protein IACHDJAJ_00093 [Aeromonas phage vB_AdhS_TS3]|nr:hypothetical protein IACHDJAJ_00093 [Aeromonas phage vB_AdhS_TS3]